MDVVLRASKDRREVPWARAAQEVTGHLGGHTWPVGWMHWDGQAYVVCDLAGAVLATVSGKRATVRGALDAAVQKVTPPPDLLATDPPPATAAVRPPAVPPSNPVPTPTKAPRPRRRPAGPNAPTVPRFDGVERRRVPVKFLPAEYDYLVRRAGVELGGNVSEFIRRRVLADREEWERKSSGGMDTPGSRP